MKKIYLDHNATSPIHPEVREAMMPHLGERFGNPSSSHWAGREARESLDGARAKVSSMINAEPHEIVFTSGGTEGDNMAIKGVLTVNGLGRHAITTAIEHPAVLKTCRFLEKFGYEFTIVGVDGQGMVDPDDIKKAIRKDTALISVMYANNETGNILPIKDISSIAHERGIITHTDAVQAAGKMPIDVQELGIDILTSSGHKFNAPKGVGFQYIREGLKIHPLLSGGHQELGFRAGTENIPGIVALGKACEIASKRMKEGTGGIKRLRDKLEKTILERVSDTVLNGHPEKRVYNTSNISFKNIEGEALMYLIEKEGIAVSTGSACASGSTEPSHVLTAMELDPLCSRGAIRFSLGYNTTEDEIDYCLSVVIPFAEKLQKMSPFYKG